MLWPIKTMKGFPVTKKIIPPPRFIKGGLAKHGPHDFHKVQIIKVRKNRVGGYRYKVKPYPQRNGGGAYWVNQNELLRVVTPLYNVE